MRVTTKYNYFKIQRDLVNDLKVRINFKKSLIQPIRWQVTFFCKGYRDAILKMIRV